MRERLGLWYSIGQFIPRQKYWLWMEQHWRNLLTMLNCGVTFDAKITFQTHLRAVSSAAAQRLGIMRKSCQNLVTSSDISLELCPAGLVVLLKFPTLNYSTELPGVIFFRARSCSLTISSSVVHAIWSESYPMHPLSGALPLLYVQSRITRGALIAHWHWSAPPCCRTSQYARTFVPLSVSLWNDLTDPVFYGVILAGCTTQPKL